MSSPDVSYLLKRGVDANAPYVITLHCKTGREMMRKEDVYRKLGYTNIVEDGLCLRVHTTTKEVMQLGMIIEGEFK